MKLTFLGTRGNIDVKSRRHRRHSSLLASYRGSRILIDCGEDWRGRIDELAPQAIFVTHAHPDHAFALKEGAPCPVYASREAWERMADFPIEERRTLAPRTPVSPSELIVEAFPVVHSLRAPAVGYRIAGGRIAVFYVPDVVEIRDRGAALGGIDLYIGDGASITRPIIRRKEGKRFGHTTIRDQLDWCAEEGVRRAVFTHCGTEITDGDERTLGPKVARLGEERGVTAEIAHDGMERVLR